MAEEISELGDLDKNEIDINNKAYKLINSYTHPNFFKISLNKEKKNIDILQVREMINFANKSTFKGIILWM